jgi:hypothetical protein
MNTTKPLVTRTLRLSCACMAAVITTTLFVSVAVGLTGEDGSDLLAQVQMVPAATVSPRSA